MAVEREFYAKEVRGAAYQPKEKTSEHVLLKEVDGDGLLDLQVPDESDWGYFKPGEVYRMKITKKQGS